LFRLRTKQQEKERINKISSKLAGGHRIKERGQKKRNLAKVHIIDRGQIHIFNVPTKSTYTENRERIKIPGGQFVEGQNGEWKREEERTLPLTKV
jgi:hypothetical protein